MTIDWVTVSAQIINFLILVWLLKRFLYQPVINAMDRREQQVTQRLKDAEQREQTATELGDSYSRQSEELQNERDQILNTARENASKIKQELLTQARSDVASTRATWKQQAELEKQQFLESLQQKVIQSVLKISRKAVADLATADLETQVVAKFISNLETLPSNEVERLRQVPESISVKSSFALGESRQRQISDVIRATLKTEAEPDFVALSGKGWGIELDIGEQRLGWNIGSYLDDLGAEFDNAMASSNG